MGRYGTIRKEFSFLQLKYDFYVLIEQKHGSYYYIIYTNAKKDIMVIYDDTVNTKIKSPIWIRVYDAECLGTAYDDVNEYRQEFFISFGTPKKRIHCAANWLKKAIEDRVVLIE